jgi:SAM-dependent methyltransferase
MEQNYQSDAYGSFAAVYDTFMDNVPYGEWSSRYEKILKENGISDGILLDLGCGTGTMTLIFQEKGYDMIGLDLSLDMLNIAREKSEGKEILYLEQDMREMELYGTVRAVLCVCDSINYILEPEEVEQVFSLVDNYLDPGGIFLFDFNTDYKYRELIGENVIAEDRDEMSFIWDNYYDEESRINEYELSLFVQEKDNLYRKYQEVHYQRGYSLEEMKAALEKAGLVFLFAEDGEEGGPVRPDSGRILVAAKEVKKAGK